MINLHVRPLEYMKLLKIRSNFSTGHFFFLTFSYNDIADDDVAFVNMSIKESKSSFYPDAGSICKHSR
jgi:hypothetical protein